MKYSIIYSINFIFIYIFIIIYIISLICSVCCSKSSICCQLPVTGRCLAAMGAGDPSGFTCLLPSFVIRVQLFLYYTEEHIYGIIHLRERFTVDIAVDSSDPVAPLFTVQFLQLLKVACKKDKG